MEQIIGYIITGLFSLAASAMMVKKSDHEKEITNTKLHQSLTDRIEALEKQAEVTNTLVDKLNKIEMLCVELKTKLEMKSGK